MRTTKPLLKKLEDQSRRMILVGYEPGSMAYRVYDPEAQRIIISRDMMLDEEAQWSWNGNDDDKTPDFNVDKLPDVWSDLTTTTAERTDVSSPVPEPSQDQGAGLSTPMPLPGAVVGSPKPGTPVATSRPVAASPPAITPTYNPSPSTFSEMLDAE